MTTTALDAEEQATTAAVGEEGPVTYPVTEEIVTTQAEGEEGPTLRPGEEVSQPSFEDPAQSISLVGNPFGGF